MDDGNVLGLGRRGSLDGPAADPGDDQDGLGATPHAGFGCAAEDQVDVGRERQTQVFDRLADVEESQVVAAGEMHQEATGLLQAVDLEQWMTQRLSARGVGHAVALPPRCISSRMWAKSTLINPARVTSSEMPCTPWRRTSSARRKATSRLSSRGTILSSRSLRTVIKGWVCGCSRRRATGASSRAVSAATAAAPDPVPPPMPAVMKTISAPERACASSRLLSIAAAAAVFGSPRAPPAPGAPGGSWV